METELIAKVAAYKAFTLAREAISQGDRFIAAELASNCVKALASQTKTVVRLRRELFYNLILAELHRETDPVRFREFALELGEKLERLGQHSPFPHFMRIIGATARGPTTGNFGDLTTSPSPPIVLSETFEDERGYFHRVDLVLRGAGLTENDLDIYSAFRSMSLRISPEATGC